MKPGMSVMEMLWHELCVRSVDLVNAVNADEVINPKDVGRVEGLAWALGKLLNPYSEDPMVRPREAIEDYIEALQNGEDVYGTAPWRTQREGPDGSKIVRGQQK